MSNNFDFQRVTAAEQPQNNMELMVDVETLGVHPGAPVITIGAVLFDPYSSDSSEELVRRSTTIKIDLEEAIKYSTGVDGGTLKWWFQQDPEAIAALTGPEAVHMKTALQDLEKYCNDRGSYTNDKFFDGISSLPKACRYWAKDPDFDMRLMQHFYEHPDISGVKCPWTFYLCRSVRTVQDLAWPGGPSDRPTWEVPGVAHDAGWDAVTQAMTVQAAFRRLGIAKDQDVQFSTWQGIGTQETTPK